MMSHTETAARGFHPGFAEAFHRTRFWDQQGRGMLTTTEVADLMGVTIHCLQFRIMRGSPAHPKPSWRRAGGAYQFEKKAVLRWLEEHHAPRD